MNSVFVQTQLASELSLHLVRLIQVFMHLGRRGGAAADGEGFVDVVTAAGLATGIVGATHLVQIVEVEVERTVEMLWVTSTEVLVPDVWVLVTGQVVNVVITLYLLLAVDHLNPLVKGLTSRSLQLPESSRGQMETEQ